MPETLVAGGQEIAIDHLPESDDSAFAQAMARPEPGGDPPDYPAPRRRRDPDAPFGFEDDGKTPKAPYGIGANGKPRQNRPGPGRAGKKDTRHDRAREQKDQAAGAAKTALEPKDYSAELAESIDGFWLGLAFLPPTQAQATILKANKLGLVNGLNLSAQHNPYVRKGVEYLCSDASWMVNAGMMVAPFLLQSLALWFRPASLKDLGTSKEELAKIAQDDFEAFKAEQEKALADLLQEMRQPPGQQLVVVAAG